MSGERGPQWRISEDAGESVLLTLYLRQVLGLRSPEDLPHLRGVSAGNAEAEFERSEAEQATLERQWRELWAMTVEPQAHPSHVPLDLVDGYGTLIALPAEGAEALREAIAPFADDARRYAKIEHARHKARSTASPGSAYRGYASAIAGFEREVGRRAHSFDLNVHVLPLQQRGVWWIGSLTIAVTDGLRADVAAFDAAIHPIIAELA